MNLKKRKGENLYVRAKFVMETIQNFLASDNEFITTLHVPRFRVDKEFNEIAIEHSDKMVKHDYLIV